MFEGLICFAAVAVSEVLTELQGCNDSSLTHMKPFEFKVFSFFTDSKELWCWHVAEMRKY